MAERQTEYKGIQKIQVRVRDVDGGNADRLPDPKDQFFVELDGDNNRYFVPINVADKTLELEMINLLRDAFFNGKNVKLGYQVLNRRRFITAVWVNR